MVIGIQGDRGSANESACLMFMKRRNLPDAEIRYLISTRNVLRELENAGIDLGVFAYKTFRGGLVEETREALRSHSCRLIDSLDLEIWHAIFKGPEFDTGKAVQIISHPQALKDHSSFLKKVFKNTALITEKDTALAARNLKNGLYPPNTLVIAPKECQKIYDLSFFLDDIPTNNGYVTTFNLVEKIDWPAAITEMSDLNGN